MKISYRAFQQEDHYEGWGFVMHGSEGEVISTGFGKLGRVLEVGTDSCRAT